jgi:hypothetical protein
MCCCLSLSFHSHICDKKTSLSLSHPYTHTYIYTFREPNVQEKAEELMEEYRLKFKFVMATYHPPGLPNEMPGKASNTRWAAQRIWAFMKSEGIDEDRVIFTVADADSDFHTVYFEALTHKFTSMSSDKAKREVTIWQPPIMHYKNYHSQPAVVKLCSLFVTQHELANLSDQSATALPYSTYRYHLSLSLYSLFFTCSFIHVIVFDKLNSSSIVPIQQYSLCGSNISQYVYINNNNNNYIYKL